MDDDDDVDMSKVLVSWVNETIGQIVWLKAFEIRESYSSKRAKIQYESVPNRP